MPPPPPPLSHLQPLGPFPLPQTLRPRRRDDDDTDDDDAYDYDDGVYCDDDDVYHDDKDVYDDDDDDDDDDDNNGEDDDGIDGGEIGSEELQGEEGRERDEAKQPQLNSNPFHPITLI